MIIGVGIDVVEIARFEQALTRTENLAARLFTDGERTLPPHSLAARFAAKEALAKALGAPRGLLWTDAEVVTHDGGGDAGVVTQRQVPPGDPEPARGGGDRAVDQQ